MGRPEGVVDVDVRQLAEGGAEGLDLVRVGLDLLPRLRGALPLLLDVVAEVLEEDHAPVGGVGARGLDLEKNILQNFGQVSSGEIVAN